MKYKYKREKKIPRALSELPADWPGRFSQLSVKMACLLGIQNEIQAVWDQPYLRVLNESSFVGVCQAWGSIWEHWGFVPIKFLEDTLAIFKLQDNAYHLI